MQLRVQLSGSESGVSPVPAGRLAPAQFPLQAETKNADLKMPSGTSVIQTHLLQERKHLEAT